jgi:hypothetical protein
MIFGLARQPEFAASSTFVRWNWLGILDLVVALGLGASMAVAAPGAISTRPWRHCPCCSSPCSSCRYS